MSENNKAEGMIGCELARGIVCVEKGWPERFSVSSMALTRWSFIVHCRRFCRPVICCRDGTTSRIMVMIDPNNVLTAPRGKEEAQPSMIAAPECQEPPWMAIWDEGFRPCGE